MEDKILELLGEEGRKFHEEFTRCQTMEEIDELKERWDRLNESRKDGTLPHHDMTLEEFRSKYHTTSHEEIMKKSIVKNSSIKSETLIKIKRNLKN